MTLPECGLTQRSKHPQEQPCTSVVPFALNPFSTQQAALVSKKALLSDKLTVWCSCAVILIHSGGKKKQQESE